MREIVNGESGVIRKLRLEGPEENERKINRPLPADHLFRTEKARLTFEKSRRFEIGSVHKTSILALIPFVAIATYAVDILADTITNTEETLYSNSNNAEVSAHC